MPDGSAQAPASRQSESNSDPLIGRLINDRFRICALIARGGMGMVYRAEQAPLGRTCAIKILDAKRAVERDPEFEKRFSLEASIASRLTHPNTVTVFDYGCTDDGLYYMAMEYLDGRTLHRAIREEGFFDEERTSYIAKQICRSLQEAHSHGVIHRDLKPANIFLAEHVDEHDFVKVLDFGLVKNIDSSGEALTQAGLFMGSPKYMAPEQIKGDEVDARTDVYALGLVMYEMLTGQVPFDHPNSVHIMMAHVNDPPPPMHVICPDAHVSAAFEALVRKCLEKDPKQRFPSMDALLNGLKGLGRASSTSLPSVRHDRDNMVTRSYGPRKAPPPSSQHADSIDKAASQHHAPGSKSDAPESRTAPQLKTSRFILAFVAAAILGIVAAIFAVRPTHVDEPTYPSTAFDVHVDPSSALSTTAPPADMPAVLLETVPPGATVVANNGTVLCTATPCEVRFEGADAEEGKAHVLAFEKPGYRRATETVIVSRKDLAARLVSLAREDNTTAPPASPSASSSPLHPAPSPSTTSP